MKNALATAVATSNGGLKTLLPMHPAVEYSASRVESEKSALVKGQMGTGVGRFGHPDAQHREVMGWAFALEPRAAALVACQSYATIGDNMGNLLYGLSLKAASIKV
jgi:hypothetical protein